MSSDFSKLLQRQLRACGIDPQSESIDRESFQKFLARVDSQYDTFQTKIQSIESLTQEVNAKALAPAVTSEDGSADKVVTFEHGYFSKALHRFLGVTRENFGSDRAYVEAATNAILTLCYIPAWSTYVLFYLLMGNMGALVSVCIGLLGSLLTLALIKWAGLYALGRTLVMSSGIIALFFISMFTGGIYSPIYTWLFFVVVAAFLTGGSRHGIFVSAAVLLSYPIAFLSSDYFLAIKVPDFFTPGKKEFGIFATLTYVLTTVFTMLITDIFYRRQRHAYEKVHEYSERARKQSLVLAEQKKDLEEQKLQMVKQQNKLMDANQKLQEMDREKSHFFQMVSHELRTPLTLILHPLNSLQRSMPNDQNLDICLRNAKRLLRLVNQLLDFQKVRTLSTDTQKQNINVDAFMGSVFESFKPLCAQKNIRFELKLHSEGNVVKGQVDALEKILFNLLSNAWKHTPEGGSITIEAERMINEMIRISIRDTGQGVPRDRQRILFKIFGQLDSPVNRTHEGSGLGLALCKELTEAMGGQIGVESEVGYGSKFWLEIPESKSSIERTENSQSAEIPLFHKLLTDIRTESPAEPAIASIQGSGTSSATPLIAVIDDVADMRHIISAKLRDWGFQTLEFGDPTEALVQIKKCKVELVITDWIMPKMTGPEVVKHLREDVDTSGTPVIMLTARADEQSKIEGVEFGANAYVGKPFDDLELKRSVENLLNLKAKEAQIQVLNHNLVNNVLARFMPPQIIEKIAAGNWLFDETPHLKPVTILFCDLHGFTQKSDLVGAKQTAFILNRYFTEMSSAIFLHSGIVDKFIGDGIMAIFGAFDDQNPTGQINAAVDCALAMQDALTNMNQEFAANHLPVFDMRVGIHYGPAMVGNFGSQSRTEFTAIGPTVNLASRVESAAKPNEILVSSTVREYLEAGKWEMAGTYNLKGVSQELPLYRIKNKVSGELRQIDAPLKKRTAS
jgi:signal transduction histidine kinase/class 3 adenylate cyclase